MSILTNPVFSEEILWEGPPRVLAVGKEKGGKRPKELSEMVLESKSEHLQRSTEASENVFESKLELRQICPDLNFVHSLGEQREVADGLSEG